MTTVKDIKAAHVLIHEIELGYYADSPTENQVEIYPVYYIYGSVLREYQGKQDSVREMRGFKAYVPAIDGLY
jgi:hypothetical protein